MQRLNPGIDYADMVFTMPTRFGQLYQRMSHDQCEAFIDVRDKHQKSVLEHLEMFSEKVAILTFIFNKLSVEKITAVCSVSNQNKQTLLHRLASKTGNGNIIDIIFNKIPVTHLAQLLLMQDKFRKTALHYQSSLCHLETFKVILRNEAFQQTVNILSCMQDNEDKTILHHFAKHSLTHYALLIEKISDKTFDKVVVLEDENKHNILYYTALVQSADVVYALHTKLLAIHKESGNPVNYPLAIASMLWKLNLPNNSVASSEDDYAPLLEKISLWLKIVIEILAEVKLPSGYFTSHSSTHSHIPLFFLMQNYLLHFCHYCYIDDAQFQRGIYPFIKEEIKSITIALYNKIPSREYFQMLKDYSSLRTSIGNRILKKNMLSDTRKLLQYIDYVPQHSTDPLKVYDFYRDLSLNSDHMDVINKYEGFLFRPESFVILHPKEFIEFYQKIVNYQVSQFSKYNREYLVIIEKALDAINKLISLPNSEYAMEYSHFQNQLLTMRNFLVNSSQQINITDLLSIKNDDEMTLHQFIQLADYCTIAATNSNIDSVTRLRLEFNSLNFLYSAAQRQLLKSPPIADEKAEIVLSLDEDDVVANHDDEDTRQSILLLNVRIIAGLDLDEEASEIRIEDARYQELVLKYKSEMQSQHALNIDTHMQEFCDYIETRANTEPFLLINTAADFNVRKAYYDALVSCHVTLNRNNLLSAVNLLNYALNDPRLTCGQSHRCLDILKKLKVDFAHRLYLFDLDAKLVVASHIRNFTLQEITNIAFMLPWEFVPYQSIDSNQYDLLLNCRDSNSISILNYYQHDSASRVMLINLFSTLRTENIDSICLLRDKNDKTLLHRLGAEKDNGDLIDLLFNSLSATTFAKLLLMQDDDNNTILHYQKSTCSLPTLEEISANDLIQTSLCKTALIQGRMGKTIFHSSWNNFVYYSHILSLLNAEKTEALLAITDKNGNNILHYIYEMNPDLIREIQKRFLDYHILSRSAHYPKALVNLIKYAGRDPRFKFNNKKLGHTPFPAGHHVVSKDVIDIKLTLLVRACAEIINAGIQPHFLSESIRFYRHTPALFELLRLIYVLHYGANGIYIHPLREHSRYLLKAIGADIFFDDLKKFRRFGLVDTLNSENDEVFEGIRFALTINDWEPFIYIQPLKLHDFFSNWHYDYLHRNPYFSFILCPWIIMPEQMRKFTEFYSKVVENQLYCISKPDGRILPVLATGIQIIDAVSTPTRAQLEQKKKLKLLFTYMTIALQQQPEPDQLLQIPINPAERVRLQLSLSRLCFAAAKSLDDEDSRKLKLNLNGVCLHHNAADKYIAEEKEDNNHTLLMVSPALSLNAVVYKALEYQAQALPTTIDKRAYATLINQYAASLKILNKTQLQTHLEEFKDYIDKRSATPPTLFTHSAEDFKVRKAYFDLIAKADNSLEAVNEKLEVIDTALNDPKLKGIMSNRCLDILNILKKDYSDVLYLLDLNTRYTLNVDMAVSRFHRP